MDGAARSAIQGTSGRRSSRTSTRGRAAAGRSSGTRRAAVAAASTRGRGGPSNLRPGQRHAAIRSGRQCLASSINGVAGRPPRRDRGDPGRAAEASFWRGRPSRCARTAARHGDEEPCLSGAAACSGLAAREHAESRSQGRDAGPNWKLRAQHERRASRLVADPQGSRSMSKSAGHHVGDLPGLEEVLLFQRAGVAWGRRSAP